MCDTYRWCLAFGVACISAYICLFAGVPLSMRYGSIVAGVGLFVAIVFSTQRATALLQFVQGSYEELRKVVWPSYREAMQLTIAVFVFVVILAVYLSVVDGLLNWILYSLLLG